MKQPVFIVDYELISPIAIGRAQLFPNLQADKPGEGLIRRFVTEGMPFRTAAELSVDLTSYYEQEPESIQEACMYDRKFELLVTAFHLAEERLKPLCEGIDESRKGVVMGVGVDVTPFEMFHDELKSFASKDLHPYKELIAKHNHRYGHINRLWNPYDVYPIYLAEKLGLGSFQKSTLSACTSSTQAIASGMDAIQQGLADLVICGGTDSIVNTLAMIAFGKLGVIPESDPSHGPTCIPFDKNRKGTLAGEAAGLLVLCTEQILRQKNLRPMAQLLGYGNSLDAYKITAPDPSGAGMHKAMSQAIAQSGIESSQIDYIQAHGTGTRQNDELELSVISRVMGEKGEGLPVSSTKNRHGHAIAAAGVQEVCVLLESMRNDFVPGNIHLDNPVETLVHLPKKNMNTPIHYALSNNFAFGGVNTVLALKNLYKEWN